MQALASFAVRADLRLGSHDLGHDAACQGSRFSRHLWPLGPDARLRYGGCARYLQRGLCVGATSDPAGHRSTALLAERDRRQPAAGHWLCAFRDWLGPRWLMSGTGIGKSREPIASCACLRHGNDRRNECARLVATASAIAHCDRECRLGKFGRVGPSHLTNVRFGSLADICSAKRHVRFTPESGHQLASLLDHLVGD